MHLLASAKTHRRTARRGFGRLALVLMLTSTLPPTHAQVDGSNAKPATRFAASLTTPPDFPDAAHVENGCYISTLGFIARFAAAFPAERAMPVTTRPHNFDEPHTIALLTWQGRWWGRDEDSGVFPLDRSIGEGGITDHLRRRATTVFEKHSIAYAKRHGFTPAALRSQSSTPAQRACDVSVAARLVPVASEQFQMRCGDEEIPLLFFRPFAGKIAVYHPLHGTATAETTMSDSAAIVTLVAARLGYKVDSVRRESSTAAPTVTAATTYASAQ